MRYREWNPWARRLTVSCVAALAAAGVLWFTPTSYYIEAPGAALDTGKMVTVQGGHPRDNRLYMLVISVEPANLFWYLYAKVDPRAELQTKQQFLGPVEDYNKYLDLTRQMMADSQRTAEAVALQQVGFGQGVSSTGAQVTDLKSDSPAVGHLQRGDVIIQAGGKPVHSANDLMAVMMATKPGALVPLRVQRMTGQTDLDVPTVENPDPARKGTAAFGIYIKDNLAFDVPVPIQIRTGDITGPSAGLMFTLQIIDQLTPGGIDRDMVIAGTGTIGPDGSVGEIGGVQQKVYTAQAAGAQVMFVPQGNYADAQKAATRVQLVPVGNVKDALTWLKQHGQVAGNTGKTGG